MSTSNPAEFAAGAIFGSALYFAGVYNPSTILGQMRLASWDMLQVMLGASATSALIIHLASRTNWAPARPRSPAILTGAIPYDGNIIGGALVGLGMALSGACPGTVLVQLGLGLPRAGTTMVGCLLGAALYQKAIHPYLSRAKTSHQAQVQGAKSGEKKSGKNSKAAAPTLYAAWGIKEETLVAIWVAMCVVGLVVLRPLRTKGKRDPVLGGLGVGFAQTATIGLARHTIGASAAFGDLVNLISGLWPAGKSAGGGKKSIAAGITPSIAFGAGVVGISALLPQVSSSSAVAAGPVVDVGAIRALAGGISMVLGARIGGGCTSGHGISGMATFAIASVITTAAMFGSGIAGSAALGALGW